MKKSLILLVSLGLVACAKPAPDAAGTPALKKIETKAEGLPTAGTPAQPAAPVGGMPAGAMGAGAAGAMPPGHPPMDPAAGGMPAGHPPMGGAPVTVTGHGPIDPSAAVDDSPLPLKKTGLGSADELARALARVASPEAKKTFEEGFRLTFCADKGRRDLSRAREAFVAVLKAQPDLAEAHRGLAYVALSMSFDVEKAEEEYEAALKLRPDYGEVHYALAFLYAGSDKQKGMGHLKRALELKVPDEQGLAKVYGM